MADAQADRIAELEAALAERDRRIAQLEAALADRDRRLAELERLVEELRRGGKRQAAPFSKGEPKPDPKTPGRKPGKAYGRQTMRPVPEKIDERIKVACPDRCDREGCRGTVKPLGDASQYQIDLPPVVPWVTEFNVGFGACELCHKTVQGRHPRQISDALRVGAVHFGPGVIAWAAVLKTVGGVSFEKIATLLTEMLGLEVNRSTLCRAVWGDADDPNAGVPGSAFAIRLTKGAAAVPAAARFRKSRRPAHPIVASVVGFSQGLEGPQKGGDQLGHRGVDVHRPLDHRVRLPRSSTVGWADSALR